MHSVDEALDWVGLSEQSHDRVSTYSLGMRQRLDWLDVVGASFAAGVGRTHQRHGPAGHGGRLECLLTMAADHGTTVFISSHLLSEVEKLCDRVGILHHGRLVAECAVDADVESTYLAATEASR